MYLFYLSVSQLRMEEGAVMNHHGMNKDEGKVRGSRFEVSI